MDLPFLGPGPVMLWRTVNMYPILWSYTLCVTCDSVPFLSMTRCKSGMIDVTAVATGRNSPSGIKPLQNYWQEFLPQSYMAEVLIFQKLDIFIFENLKKLKFPLLIVELLCAIGYTLTGKFIYLMFSIPWTLSAAKALILF